MARGSSELKYERMEAEFYAAAASGARKSTARPDWQSYEPSEREKRRTVPKPRYDADIHQVAPLKILTPAEIRAICLVVFIVTAIAMCIILLSAQAAVAQKEINDIRKGIARVDDDIANLKIEIEQSQNMQLIKDRAQAELGMKEPTFDQYVYTEELPELQPNFGKYIKERAYGGERNQPEEPETE